MKKVGILTFHYGDNYGAVLQSYALRRTINSLPDCMAEIINYIPANYLAKKIEAAYDDRAAYLEKRKKFEKFLDTHCGVKKEMVQHVTGEEYDYLCVGSDQVWNPIYFDEEYFFLSASYGKKISYAASLGKPMKDCEFFADMYKQNLADFSFLTVRESEHVDFLKETTGKECTLVLDPTLLLKRVDYEQLMCLEDNESEDYILFFWLRDNDVFLRGLELVNSIARKYNYKIVNIKNKRYDIIADSMDMLMVKVDNNIKINDKSSHNSNSNNCSDNCQNNYQYIALLLFFLSNQLTNLGKFY